MNNIRYPYKNATAQSRGKSPSGSLGQQNGRQNVALWTASVFIWLSFYRLKDPFFFWNPPFALTFRVISQNRCLFHGYHLASWANPHWHSLRLRICRAINRYSVAPMRQKIALSQSNRLPSADYRLEVKYGVSYGGNLPFANATSWSDKLVIEE